MGVDTHLDVHVAAALDPIGGVLGVESFAATPSGYRAMLEWLVAFGTVNKVGVEGTGAYGAGLARFLRRAGVERDRGRPPQPSGRAGRRASRTPPTRWRPPGPS